MGCGCGGSAPPQQRQVRREAGATQPQKPAGGGPGQAGYYWEGPKRPAPAEPAKNA